MNDKLTAPLSYLKYNLSVIPTNKDKLPAVAEWASFQSRLPTADELKKWFSYNDLNVAVICGKVSGYFEVIDFDCNAEALKAWAELATEQAPGLLDTLIIEKSPHGCHVMYRSKGPISGNIKLAFRAVSVSGPGDHEYKGKKLRAQQVNGQWVIIPVLIETRGEGGYCLVNPSKGYKLTQGSFSKIPVISVEEREILIECSRACNLFHPPSETQKGYERTSSSEKLPGQDFDERADIRPLLEKHGWRCKGSGRDGRERWARPGKDRGHSATLTDGKVFYVFSQNAPPLYAPRAYAPFGVYTLLEHGGDFKAAAKALAAQGYGAKQERSNTVPYGSDAKVTGLGFDELSKLFSEDAEYLFQKRVPRGMPSMLTGMPGVGKTSIALAMTNEILEQHPEGMSIWVSTEGQTQDTLLKIAEIGGLLLDKSRFQIARQGNGSFMFNFHHEAERKALDGFLSSLPLPVLLVIVDSLRGASENIDENSKVMGDMMNRTQGYICDKHRAGCLWIHHWNKKQNVSDSQRISGNTAITGAVRIAFSVTEESHHVRKLSVSKKNLTDVATEPLKVIKTATGFLFYEDAPTEASLVKQGEEFLIDLFSKTKRHYTITVFDKGKELGLQPSVLKAAKKHLPIISYSEGKVGSKEQKWVWEWKHSYRAAESCLSGETGENDEKKSNENNERHESHERNEVLPKDLRESRGTRGTRESRGIFEKKENVSHKKESEHTYLELNQRDISHTLQKNPINDIEIIDSDRDPF
jgi:hypothetical protein